MQVEHFKLQPSTAAGIVIINKVTLAQPLLLLGLSVFICKAARPAHLAGRLSLEAQPVGR